MKVRLEILEKYPHRLQIKIPEGARFWVEQVEKLKHVHQHGPGHYSMMYYPWAVAQLRKLYRDQLEIGFEESTYPPVVYKKKEGGQSRRAEKVRPRYYQALDALEQWIRLRQYSHATLKSYRGCFTRFLLYYNDKAPDQISVEEIRLARNLNYRYL